MRRALKLKVALAIGVLVSLSSCLYEFKRDGARCGKGATCPPGQRCSVDGECLKPCPEANCLGDGCGCDRNDYVYSEIPRTCLSDGLCHMVCGVASPPCRDPSVCDLSWGLCRPSCSEGTCANDAGCVSNGGSTFCRGSWPDAGTGQDADPG